MAAETPVLERNIGERKERFESAVPSRYDILAEEEHNARIRETYARLINPANKIEDVFASNRVAAQPAVVAQPAAVAQPVAVEQPAVAAQPAAAVQAPVEQARPYLVQNARANASIFRADSEINARAAEQETVASAMEVVAEVNEEEDEDLRPTRTTIQYKTLGESAAENKVMSVTDTRPHVFGKKEKIIVAIFVAVVVALLVLIVVNSTVIANLNMDIATVQEKITTVKGALAGVNGTMEDIIRTGMGQ